MVTLSWEVIPFVSLDGLQTVTPVARSTLYSAQIGNPFRL